VTKGKKHEAKATWWWMRMSKRLSRRMSATRVGTMIEDMQHGEVTKRPRKMQGEL
jgi:hypothetical protein